MPRSPLVTLAGIGIAAILLMAVLWLVTLRQVGDPAAGAAATEIADTLGHNLAQGSKPTVTMFREGPGLTAPRRYVVRLAPAEGLVHDAAALETLARTAAGMVAEHLQRVKEPTQVHVVLESGAVPRVEHCYRRAGDADAWSLEPVVPVPPLPAPGPAGDAP